MEDKKVEVRSRMIGIFILFFIVVVMLLSTTSLKDKINILGGYRAKTLETIREVNHKIPVEAPIGVYNKSLIYFHENKIISINFQGVTQWNRTIMYEKPILYFGDERIYICDSSTGEIVSLDLDGNEMWTYNARQTIDNIIEKDKYLVIFTKAGNSIDQINFIDSKGRLVANRIIENDKIVLGVISEDQKKQALATINIDGGVIESKLHLYSNDESTVVNEIFYDQIIINIDFINNKDIIVVTDKKIAYINNNKELLWSRDLEGQIKDLVLDKDRGEISVLYEDKDSYLETIKRDGRTELKTRHSNEYSKIIISNDNIYLIGKRKILGLNNEFEFLKYKDDTDIVELLINDDKAIIVTHEGIKEMQINNSKE